MHDLWDRAVLCYQATSISSHVKITQVNKPHYDNYLMGYSYVKLKLTRRPRRNKTEF